MSHFQDGFVGDRGPCDKGASLIHSTTPPQFGHSLHLRYRERERDREKAEDTKEKRRARYGTHALSFAETQNR